MFLPDMVVGEWTEGMKSGSVRALDYRVVVKPAFRKFSLNIGRGQHVRNRSGKDRKLTGKQERIMQVSDQNPPSPRPSVPKTTTPCIETQAITEATSNW